MLKIRKIVPEDIEFIIDINSESRFTGDKLLSNIGNFLVCEIDGVKSGCGCIALSSDNGFISWVTVKAGYRRQRYGDAIVRALLNIADLRGIKKVYGTGICGSFLISMGFEKQCNRIVINEIKKVFGDNSISEYYGVSLIGYFKHCF